MLTDLIEIEVRLAEAVRCDSPKILDAARQGQTTYNDLGNYNYMQAAYLAGHLFALRHPANTLRGQTWCAELAIAMTDKMIAAWRNARHVGDGINVAEWSPLTTVELLEFLAPLIDSARRQRWMEFLDFYLDFACKRPYGFTSPNHEAWRQLLLYRAGQILNRPQLCELALFLCKQELEYQTKEGFWEESFHHGPSMKYNQIMLAPLAWLYRLTGDAKIGEAVKRLACFMATYTFPDGTTIGTFDGRQSTSLAFFSPVCPGLEFIPEGRLLNQRCMQIYRETGADVNMKFFENSIWYVYFGLFFHAASCRYYAEVVPEAERDQALQAEPATRLLIDQDVSLENHTAEFDGVLHRNGAWVVALSSQNSDIPRVAPNLYRLERESRIEIWHKDTRLLLGGGHSRYDNPRPLANVVLDTGYCGETEFGYMAAEQDEKRRSYYMPRFTSSCVNQGVPELKFVFGHGTVLFRLIARNDHEMEIEAQWDTRNVQRLCLQLPMIVWHEAELLLDGIAVDAKQKKSHELKNLLTLKGGYFKGITQLQIPFGVPCRIHCGEEILRHYLESMPEPDLYLPQFGIVIVSVQWDNPVSEGSATFKLTTKKND